MRPSLERMPSEAPDSSLLRCVTMTNTQDEGCPGRPPTRNPHVLIREVG